MIDAIQGALGLLLLAGLVLFGIYLVVSRIRFAGRLRSRVRRAHAAALAASLDDPAFEPAVALTAAREQYATVQGRHRGDALGHAAQMLGGGVVEGTNWLDRSIGSPGSSWIRVKARPDIDIVGVRNLAGTHADRVVIRVVARVRRWRRLLGPYWLARSLHIVFFPMWARLDMALALAYRAEAYWTFGSNDGQWVLAKVQAGIQGAHNLDEPLITASWEEMERLRDDAVHELALASAPSGAPAALHSAGADAQSAAADAGVADARFAPLTIEASVRRVAAAWAESPYDEAASLASVADRAAHTSLLSEPVPHGLHLESMRLVEFEGNATPPTVGVQVTARGRAGEAAANEHLPGWWPQPKETFELLWTLALTEDEACPWHLQSSRKT